MTNGPASLARNIAAEINRVIVGRPQAVRHALYGLMAGGHCLFEDVPGTAKTMLVKTLSRAAGLQFNRVQFTPDLLPADINGTTVYNMKDGSFSLREGPIFTQILLGDELNRAPPKTQAALLEAMQEGQVTLDGRTRPLPRPFLVYATQNPIESEGVYVLPEAELDRFMLRIRMGYPDEAEERAILERVESWKGGEPKVSRVADGKGIVAMQNAVHSVHVHPDLKAYIVRLVQATRGDERVLVGASPRGSIAIQAAAKAAALYRGRRHATDEDVKEVATAAIGHRLLMEPEAAARGTTAEEVVRDILRRIPTPNVPKVAR